MNRSDAQNNKSVPGQSTPTRVLYLDHTARWSGGEIALYRFITALNKSRYEPVVVLGEEGMLAEKLREANIRTLVEPLDAEVREVRKDSLGGGGIARKLLMEGPALLDYARRLASIAHVNRCEIIHCNSLKSDIYGAIAGRMAKLPIIWHIRDHIAATYLPSVTVRTIRELSRRLPTHVICNSRSTWLALFGANEAQATTPRQAARHSVVMDCVGEDFLNFAEPVPRKTWRAEGDETPLRIGIVGRLTRWKGQHVFLSAMKAVAEKWKQSGNKPELRFVVAGGALFGEDDYAAQMQEQARHDFAESEIEWCGNVADVPGLMGSLDLLIHASITPEPFGQVVIEGMAAGLPVIATRGGGVPEILRENETGLLVPMDDAHALADTTFTLLCQPEQAMRFGQNGWREVRNRFLPEHTAKTIELIYDRLNKRTERG